jgi:ryanodine receptor 2
MIGLVEGSAWYTRWYFEAEVEHIYQTTSLKPVLRVGWANTNGFVAYPGSGDMMGCMAVGDDLFR